MNETGEVRLLDRITDSAEDLDRFSRAELATVFDDRRAVDVLHRNVGELARPERGFDLRLTGIMNRRDAGVLQAREHRRFESKPLEQLSGGEFGTHDLQRHRPLRLRLLGEMHDPHATRAENLLNAEAIHHSPRLEPPTEVPGLPGGLPIDTLVRIEGDGRPLERLLGPIVLSEEAPHLVDEPRRIRGPLIEKRAARLRRQIAGLLEELEETVEVEVLDAGLRSERRGERRERWVWLAGGGV